MFTLTILGAELYVILWFFFIFSVLGVVVEMLYAIAQDGVIESRRGLLYLPLSPIYGIGGVLITLFLLPYVHEPLILFFVGMLVGSALEYVASLVMEKAFHTVFWDYSKEPLNLHGRICLRYSIYWGLLSLLLIYVIDVWTYRIVEAINRSIGEIVLIVIMVPTVFSIMVTLFAFDRLKRKVSELRAADVGGTAAFHPGHGRAAALLDRLAPDQLIINTFPRMSLVTEYCRLTELQPRQIEVGLRAPRRVRERLVR